MKKFEYWIELMPDEDSDLFDFLNKKGSDGWELIAITLSANEFKIAIFKREIINRG